ncbi:unnamed protein product [Boreogadus saida]
MARHIPSRSLALATVSGPLTRLAGARHADWGWGTWRTGACIRYRTRHNLPTSFPRHETPRFVTALTGEVQHLR